MGRALGFSPVVDNGELCLAVSRYSAEKHRPLETVRTPGVCVQINAGRKDDTSLGE
jgi:hypothetical protein